MTENWTEEDEKRMEVVMQNGNSAQHYEHQSMINLIDSQIKFLDSQKENLLQQRREYINRNDLNKCGNLQK